MIDCRCRYRSAKLKLVIGYKPIVFLRPRSLVRDPFFLVLSTLASTVVVRLAAFTHITSAEKNTRRGG